MSIRSLMTASRPSTGIKTIRPFQILIGALMAVFLVGFDLSGQSVPIEEILPGGPPKDGIPALLNPRFVEAGRVDFLGRNDRVLGLYENGEAKAYPVKILNWHEVVNDVVGQKPVVITYCPLCGSGMAFDAQVEGKWLTFGVSGLLYNSDMLMYDHQPIAILAATCLLDDPANSVMI